MCTCKRCQDMCVIPCCPTPEEVEKLIANGYKDYLRVYRDMGENHIKVIKPKGKKDFGDRSLYCIFQNDDKLCKIHNNKPMEGVLADCNMSSNDSQLLFEMVVDTWDNVKGQELVRTFEGEF